MDTTTAIIQFIGIVLFSAQVPNDPGVHAILPRIGHVHTIHSNNTTAGPAEEQESFIDDVESHVAAILYRKTDRLDIPGAWRADGTLKNDWQYVLLDGEHVQFLSNGRNGQPTIPVTLPRAGIAESCNLIAAPTLRSPFQAPYRGTIGVIDIPAGTLDACETPSTNRVDTRLFIDTDGVLVIAATKPGNRAKTISLDADAVVYVANVPPGYVLTGEELIGGGEPHWDAYNDMLDQPCSVRPQPEKPEGVEYCDVSQLTEAYKAARKAPPSKDFPQMIDSECSNTQWP